MLTPRQQDLWEAYLRVEARGARAQKHAALNLFLDELTKSPVSEWTDWALEIARQSVDTNVGRVVRMPLFERALFPVLLAGLLEQRPGCARWLAGLSQLVYRSKRCNEQLPLDARTEYMLLKLALRHDPSDVTSKSRLLGVCDYYLRNSLHELPAGVLRWQDVATPDECLELQELLNEFVTLADDLGRRSEYVEFIAKCDFHFRAYRDYLLTTKGNESYAEYMQRVGGEPGA
jgi:hypothetical protein